MTRKWTEVIKNTGGYWGMYYSSSKSWHKPYLVEYLGNKLN